MGPIHMTLIVQQKQNFDSLIKQGQKNWGARQFIRAVSYTALMAVITSQPAWAQSVPGTPECIISGDEVTCSGDISDGLLPMG